MAGETNSIVFVPDEDKTTNKPAEVQFRNLRVFDTSAACALGLQQANTLSNQSTLDFSSVSITSFSNQYVDKKYEISDGGTALSLYSNTWKSITINQTITPKTVLEFEIKTTGVGEKQA